MYNAPYFCEFNPIEGFFSLVKSIARPQIYLKRFTKLKSDEFAAIIASAVLSASV